MYIGEKMAVTKQELYEKLARLGYSVSEFADMWDIHKDTVYRWANTGIPRWVITILNLMEQVGREKVERYGGKAPPVRYAADDSPPSKFRQSLEQEKDVAPVKRRGRPRKNPEN
jgi:hypothetical protein